MTSTSDQQYPVIAVARCDMKRGQTITEDMIGDMEGGPLLAFARRLVTLFDDHAPRNATQPRESGFLAAIHERTPSGAWIAVQHHSDGDWSVAERPLPWLPGGEVAVPETREAELQADIDSPAARVEYARLCFTTILETPDDAKALARAGLDLCNLTASQRAEMRGDA